MYNERQSFIKCSEKENSKNGAKINMNEQNKDDIQEEEKREKNYRKGKVHRYGQWTE